MAAPTGTSLLSSLLQFPLAPFSGKSSAPSAVQMPPRRAPTAVLASKGYNVQIVVDEGEGEDSIFRRFRREVMKAGLLQEIKRRRRHENAKDIKIRKAREAGRRNRRRRMMDDRRFPEDEGDSEAVRTRRDEDNDNWEVCVSLDGGARWSSAVVHLHPPRSRIGGFVLRGFSRPDSVRWRIWMLMVRKTTTGCCTAELKIHGAPFSGAVSGDFPVARELVRQSLECVRPAAAARLSLAMDAGEVGVQKLVVLLLLEDLKFDVLVQKVRDISIRFAHVLPVRAGGSCGVEYVGPPSPTSGLSKLALDLVQIVQSPYE